MSRTFQCKAIPSTWLEHNGRRLDCGPYMSGAIEARELLKKHRTEPLKNLTAGIYHAGRRSRIWVDTPEHGVPFMGSTDILAADLSALPLISRKQVDANPSFTIREGWTLITRSGTVGRMAYARPDMDGLACSEHVMRVAPDTEKVKPGYLFAFLSSRFGVPIVISGTYGAIIPHIEPHHLADLPVPRLGDVEDRVNELVRQAADLRAEASRLIADAIRKLEDAAGLDSLLQSSVTPERLNISFISSFDVVKRMDAVFHSSAHRMAIEKLKGSTCSAITVGEISSAVLEPKRFKRVQAEDQQHGWPFFGTTALMWADPHPSYFILKSTPKVRSLIVDKRTVLVPRSGRLSGIIGIAVLPYGRMVGGAVSEDAIRVHCRTEVDAGYMFTALRSQYGKQQLKARAYGSSIPTLDVTQVKEVLVPNIPDKDRKLIGEMGSRSSALRSEAISLEDRARALVEHAIQEGSF